MPLRIDRCPDLPLRRLRTPAEETRLRRHTSVPVDDQSLHPAGLCGLWRQVAQSLLEQGRGQTEHVAVHRGHVVDRC